MVTLFHTLRRLVLSVVAVAVALMLARYAVDLLPASPVLADLAAVVRRWTQPAISLASRKFDIPQYTGLWNPLPLGLALASMVLGAVVIDAIDFLLGRPSRIVQRPAPRAARAPAAPAVQPAPVPAAVPAPAAVADPATSTAFNPTPTSSGATRPSRIGRYEIIDELGRGAMGVVYKARDPQIGRTVAIKTILAGIGADPTSEEYKKRFFAEARAAGGLNHPGIIKVHDLIEDAGRACLVLEYFDGQTLDKLVETKPLTLRESLKIITQAAEALGFAHDHGVVHRDIKPGNIMVSAAGHAVISDFGIAKIEDTHMTATGTILGTPAYMSPEQVQGLAVDHRSDIFSLGTVLYWLLTGERPFAGSTFTSIAYNVVHTMPRPALEVTPNLPPPLDQVVAKCLAKAPMDRYATAHELAAALRAVPVA